MERRPDVVLDGESAYLVVYRVKGDEKVAYDVGTQRDGRVIAVHFDLMADDQEAADAVVAAVVASFTWR